MTNTRLTDPEILEFRYPVVLEDFHIRKGSGGKGKWNAGDASAARYDSWKKWIARCSRPPRRAAVRMAGATRPSRREFVRRKDGSIEKLKAATPP